MSNWREIRAKRPPREDRVALHRAHLDEVVERANSAKVILWILGFFPFAIYLFAARSKKATENR